ncbi:MAG: Pycsar system effector family protein [bacterium]
MANEIIKMVEEYVLNLLTEKSSPDKVYHDLEHTKDVVKQARKIGEGMELKTSDLELVTIAAWFHDVGYIETKEGHEEISARYAREFLTTNGYPEDKINTITNCILATKVPQRPKNLVEEILCDADLHHLGSDYFNDRNDLFRMETEKNIDHELSDMEWLKGTIDFMSEHKYFTAYAKDKFQEEKNENLYKLQKKLKKKLKKSEEAKIWEEKIAIEKERLQNKKDTLNKPERGVETMFRNVTRTHMELSGMADSKANIMISVNTLILTAVVAVMSRKLDSNPHLIIPTIIITLVSLVTLIFAIMVTRPIITSGIFTKDDITRKRANLLFFGNFYKMNLDDFTWGMSELITDKDYLYTSMIKDFYYLGQVLGKKYKNLRICYNIFMYGLIISVIAFTIAVIIAPVPTDLGTF